MPRKYTIDFAIVILFMFALYITLLSTYVHKTIANLKRKTRAYIYLAKLLKVIPSKAWRGNPHGGCPGKCSHLETLYIQSTGRVSR